MYLQFMFLAKIKIFIRNCYFYSCKNHCILHGRVIIMIERGNGKEQLLVPGDEM